MVGGGGGSANAASAQNQADAMRAGKGAESFLRRSDWLTLALAAIPIVAILVLALFVL
jgi:preprotein translocase subunit SecG